MKLDTVYIISYMNNEKFNARSKSLIKQAEWLAQIPQIKNIEYIAQCWTDELKSKILEIYKDSNKKVEYHYKGQLSTAFARNMNLRKFYESDNDVAIFLDDDVKVEIYDKSMDIFEFYEKYVENKIDFDVIGFTGSLYGNKNKDSWAKLKRAVWAASNALIIKNINKSKGTQHWFCEVLPALEDFDFGIDMNYYGYKYFICENPYVKELSSATIMFENKKDRKTRNTKAREIITNNWNNRIGTTAFYFTKNGNLMQSMFKKMFVKKQEILIHKDGKTNDTAGSSFSKLFK